MPSWRARSLICCVNQPVGADPALAARVLACANGPEGLESHRQIAGIPEALALLGTLQLRELVGSAPLGTTRAAYRA